MIKATEDNRQYNTSTPQQTWILIPFDNTMKSLSGIQTKAMQKRCYHTSPIELELKHTTMATSQKESLRIQMAHPITYHATETTNLTLKKLQYNLSEQQKTL